MDDLSCDDSLASSILRMNQYNDNNNVPLSTDPVAAALPAASTNTAATNSSTTAGTIVARNVIDNVNNTARSDTNLDNQLEYSDDLNEAIVLGNYILLYVIINNT